MPGLSDIGQVDWSDETLVWSLGATRLMSANALYMNCL
jgi:hypothetical protein